MANTTWNPSDKTAGVTLSGSNLIGTFSAVGLQQCRSVDYQVTGKFYWEYTFTNATNNACGIARGSVSGLGTAVATSVGAAFVNSAGSLNVDGAGVAALGAISNGNVVCFALDLDNRLIWVRLGAAGNWNNTVGANPATLTGGLAIPFGGGVPAYCVMSGNNANPSGAITANFGDSAFTGTAPGGATGGFTAGFTTATNELLTQIALEEWGRGTSDLQLTQIAIEEWAAVQTVTPQLVLTQIVIEQWAAVSPVVIPPGGQTAVAINSS